MIIVWNQNDGKFDPNIATINIWRIFKTKHIWLNQSINLTMLFLKNASAWLRKREKTKILNKFNQTKKSSSSSNNDFEVNFIGLNLFTSANKRNKKKIQVIIMFWIIHILSLSFISCSVVIFFVHHHQHYIHFKVVVVVMVVVVDIPTIYKIHL